MTYSQAPLSYLNLSISRDSQSNWGEIINSWHLIDNFLCQFIYILSGVVNIVILQPTILNLLLLVFDFKVFQYWEDRNSEQHFSLVFSNLLHFCDVINRWITQPYILSSHRDIIKKYTLQFCLIESRLWYWNPYWILRSCQQLNWNGNDNKQYYI